MNPTPELLEYLSMVLDLYLLAEELAKDPSKITLIIPIGDAIHGMHKIIEICSGDNPP